MRFSVGENHGLDFNDTSTAARARADMFHKSEKLVSSFPGTGFPEVRVCFPRKLREETGFRVEEA